MIAITSLLQSWCFNIQLQVSDCFRSSAKLSVKSSIRVRYLGTKYTIPDTHSLVCLILQLCPQSQNKCPLLFPLILSYLENNVYFLFCIFLIFFSSSSWPLNVFCPATALVFTTQKESQMVLSFSDFILILLVVLSQGRFTGRKSQGSRSQHLSFVVDKKSFVEISNKKLY